MGGRGGMVRLSRKDGGRGSASKIALLRLVTLRLTGWAHTLREDELDASRAEAVGAVVQAGRDAVGLAGGAEAQDAQRVAPVALAGRAGAVQSLRAAKTEGGSAAKPRTDGLVVTSQSQTWSRAH